MSRRKWSNASALDRRAPVPMNATCGITIAVTDVADLSRNGADAGVVLLVADCGTTKYSAESVVDALAANVTHPESDAGSIDAYAATARLNCVPGVAHDAKPGPAELLLHAASSTTLPRAAMAAVRDCTITWCSVVIPRDRRMLDLIPIPPTGVRRNAKRRHRRP